jgi:hypothetical protein
MCRVPKAPTCGEHSGAGGAARTPRGSQPESSFIDAAELERMLSVALTGQGPRGAAPRGPTLAPRALSPGDAGRSGAPVAFVSQAWRAPFGPAADQWLDADAVAESSAATHSTTHSSPAA